MGWMLLLRRFWWALPIAGLAIALMITRSTLEKRTALLEAVKRQTAVILLEIREAADNPRLSMADAARQVRAIAETSADRKRVMGTQSRSIERLGRERADALAEAGRRQRALAVALKQREGLQRRLKALAGDAEILACETELRKTEAVLDALYEEGL